MAHHTSFVSSAEKPYAATARLCTALVAGHRHECQRPIVESAEISLCALHMLLAVQEAKRIGATALVHLAQVDDHNRQEAFA